jgi:hypothetical protein
MKNKPSFNQTNKVILFNYLSLNNCLSHIYMWV